MPPLFLQNLSSATYLQIKKKIFLNQFKFFWAHKSLTLKHQENIISKEIKKKYLIFNL